MKRITSNVGNNQHSNPEDILEIKKALKSMGLYNGDVHMPFTDSEMDRGIRQLQSSQNLKSDGLIKPGGETEYAIFELLTKSPGQKCVVCGGWHGSVYGDTCPDCTIKQ